MDDVSTPRRRVRGGLSLWAASPRRAVRVREKLGPVTCDVAVVGAGITGALAALALAQEGHRVVILDRQAPVTGSTLASTAMINFELDVPLTALARKVGQPRAARAYVRAYKAVRALRGLVERHGFDCGWQARDSLYLAGEDMGWRGLEAEAKARAKAGLPSHFMDADMLARRYGIARTGAVVSKGNAECNPAQLAAAVLRAAQDAGAVIYSPHEVQDVVAGHDGVALRTTAGLAVIAKRAVFATGYTALARIPKYKYRLISTWALATKPLPVDALWPTRCLIWEASDPYLYLRTTTDNRIVAGGEDADFTDPGKRDALTARKARTILRKAATLLGSRDLRLDYAWSGTFATSATGLPYISEVPGMANCFAILACGGNGIVFAQVASEMAAAWASGRKDRDFKIFG